MTSPQLPDCYRCGRPAVEHGSGWRCPHDNHPLGMIVAGTLIAVVAAVVWLMTRTDAALCSSALVTALDPRQCQAYTTVHDVAAVGFLIGVGLAFIGGLRR